MKKVILGLVFIIIFSIGLGVYFLFTNLDALVKDAIETHGSAATQTAVRVDKVKIGLSEGTGTISGLTIANTSGFSMPYAFSLGEIRTGINLQSLQQEPYVISEITVIAPQIFVEINEDNKTNLNELKKSLMASQSDTGSEKTQSPDEGVAADSGDKAEPRLIIRRISFTDGNIQARVAALDNKEYQLKLPTINMSNLGGNNGATPADLAREIINHLTDRASEEVKKKIIDAELDKVRAEARAKIDAEKSRIKEMSDAKIDEKKTKAKDKLKGFFGK